MIAFLQNLDFADTMMLVVFPAFPIACWFIYLLLILRRNNPLVLSQQREVPWGVLDVLILIATMWLAKLVGQIVAVFLIAASEGIAIDAIDSTVAMRNANILLPCSIVFSILQLGLAVFFLKRFHHATFEDLGINRKSLGRDIGVGLVGSLMIIPVILMINIIIHMFLSEKYDHQVMVLIRHSMIFAGLSTVVVAPLVEEFHFRIFLQGWMQRIFRMDPTKKMRVIQGDARTEKMLVKKLKRESAERVPIWPIFLCSLIFAAMHSGQGAAPYALFVFSVFLGFLYRQTHSVVPCIVVHFVLNLWSFVALIYSLD